jgi:hypothetical protein
MRANQETPLRPGRCGHARIPGSGRLAGNRVPDPPKQAAARRSSPRVPGDGLDREGTRRTRNLS